MENKPIIRFNNLNSEWGRIKLNKVLKPSNLKNKDNKYQKDDMLSVSSSVGVVNQMDYHGRSYAGKSVLPYRILKRNEVVYTKSPLKEFPYGIIKHNSFKSGIVSTLYAIYEVNDGFLGEFVDYYFQLPNRINKYLKPLVNIGAKNDMKVNNEKVLIDPVYFPNIEEQKKIVSFLSKVDEKITLLTKKKVLLEEYKKGVTQKIFKQEIRFKDENGNDFPKWEKRKLGKLTYKTGKKNKENISYPIYSINNQEGFLPQSEQFEGLDSNDRGYDISMYKIVNEKTFAYNPARINVGSIGYSHDLSKVIISSLYVCFKTDEELEDLYLLVYLNTDRFNSDILRYEEGGVRQYLFYDNFSQIKIPLPSNKEQIKIAGFISSIDKKIMALDNQLSLAKEWKKGLLQKMFV